MRSLCADGTDETLRLWMEVIQMNDDEQGFELDRGFLIRVDAYDSRAAPR